MKSTEQERAEFELMRAAFELEMIDNHFCVPSDFRDAGLQSDGSFVDDDLNDAVAIWDAAWQAARRAPVVLVPQDPMDWPLPCDVTVGHGTMRKGVALRTLILRMKALYKMATGNDADEVAARTPEQRAALLDAFQSKIAAAPQPPEQNQTTFQTQVGEAAPVQLPSPIGVVRVFEPHENSGVVCTEASVNAGHLPHGWHLLYTEHQVRQLLAAQDKP